VTTRIEEADGATLHSFGAVQVRPPAAFVAPAGAWEEAI
jgi:hypothetical protein